jgi:hypothetical protein
VSEAQMAAEHCSRKLTKVIPMTAAAKQKSMLDKIIDNLNQMGAQTTQ